MKHVDPCDVYGSPAQQPKEANPNGYIVTLLKFIPILLYSIVKISRIYIIFIALF